MALGDVKQVFERSGINDPLEIAEYVACLLLLIDAESDPTKKQYDDLDWFSSEKPRFPESLSANTLKQAYDELSKIVAATAPAKILHTYVRHELLKTASGKQYPTPNHVAEFLAELVIPDPQAKPTVLDPVGGTAGLLVEVGKRAKGATLYGCDFDRRWLSIGAANLFLNTQVDESKYLLRTAQNLLAEGGELYGTYDAALMNPPFGQDTLDLVKVAFKALGAGGRGAFLVPSGLLFQGGQAKALRDDLAKHTLEAIITLPEDAFRPYSQTTAHLLLVQKSEQEAEPADEVWFMRLTQDGYPPGVTRDLLQPPDPETNELPRAAALVKQTREDDWDDALTFVVDEGDDRREVKAQVLRPQSGLPGVVVRVMGGLELDARHTSEALLVTVKTDSSSCVLHLPYKTDEPHKFALAEDSFAWTEELKLEGDEVKRTWHGEEGVMLEVGDELTLKKASKQLEFTQNTLNDAKSVACVFDSDGNPTTNWYGLKDPKNDYQRQLDELNDWGGKRVDGAEKLGWLFDLSEDDQSASLLIIDASEGAQGQLYASDGSAIALLENGWLTVKDKKLVVTPANKVDLSAQTSFTAFAVGPLPGLSDDYNLFALRLPRSEWENATSLEPSRFMPASPPEPVGAPSDVLARVRENQYELSQRMDSLFSLLGGSAGYQEKEEGLEPVLLKSFGAKQHYLYKMIEELTHEDKPAHFDVGMLLCELRKKEQQDNAITRFENDELSQQLLLFELMGVITKVHFRSQDSDEVQNMYRLVVVSDDQGVVLDAT